MRLSSIFSFETLQIDRAELRRLAAIAIVAAVTVTTGELLARWSGALGSLPVNDTGVGTVLEYLATRNGELDMIIVGSSQANTNISPRDLTAAFEGGPREGTSVFNAGLSAHNAMDIEFLHRELPHLFEADSMLLVVGLPGVRSAGTEPRNVDSYGIDYLRGQLTPIENALMEMKLFRYRRLLRHPRYQAYAARRLSLDGDLKRRLGPYSLGFHPAQGAVFKRTLDDEGEIVAERFEMPPAVETRLGEMIDRTLEAGTEVILLVPPHAPKLAALMSAPDEDWSAFLSKMGRIADARRITLIDHHDHEDFGNGAFYDRIHMTNEAAVEYSRVLGHTLSAGGHPDPAVTRSPTDLPRY